jgi:hypothetical protein
VKPPKRIRVGPHDYGVVITAPGVLEDAGADGTCVPRRLRIALDGGQPHSQMADALLHEISHGLLERVKLEDDVEEAVCLVLGPGLLELLVDNPRLVKWLIYGGDGTP